MGITEMAVPDAYRITPRLLGDARGSFHESYAHDALAEATGHVFRPSQVNYSVSRRDTLRGLHGVSIPPGQAKYVTCVRGSLLDVVVDLRLGSPTFGTWDSTVLDAHEATAVYVAEGLVHGFVAMADDTCISYLCSTQYVPGTQFEIQPFDAELALPWERAVSPGGKVLMSEKDEQAPTLAQAADRGLLARYEDCLALYGRLRREDAA
ncbi:dTDP-4-dehydrorhamnose 3,5-epimerase family protein [Streptomyces sp. NRRL F-5126]|uniref:dTDP-4-dehydrorhamnose 3,5-epimerase family protein n=1 Tax=Streptomyces sp. NRRL F-5126 TaxID=1463857 RepID=UPI0004CC0E3C|nr:dTDP-4-dehydrorhamnose 3,5-epimerase family protein [Streptomyces sp. NRRL F-5126]